jgi:hypothetical protein
MLGEKAYGGAPLRKELDGRGTQVFHRCNRSQQLQQASLQVHSLIESAFNRSKGFRRIAIRMAGWHEITWSLSATPLLSYDGFNESRSW